MSVISTEFLIGPEAAEESHIQLSIGGSIVGVKASRWRMSERVRTPCEAGF